MGSHLDGVLAGSLLDAETNLTTAAQASSNQGLYTGQKRSHLRLIPHSDLFVALAAASFAQQTSLQHRSASHGCSLLLPRTRPADCRAVPTIPDPGTLPYCSFSPSPKALPVPLASKRYQRYSSKALRGSKPPRLRGTNIAPAWKQDVADSPARPRLTAEQTAYLEAEFAKEPTPSRETKNRYAMQLGLPKEKIDNWFQNRRAKSRHQPRHSHTQLGDLSLLTVDGVNPQLDQIMAMSQMQQPARQMTFPLMQGQMLPSSDADVNQFQYWEHGHDYAFDNAALNDASMSQLALAQGFSGHDMDQFLSNSQNVFDGDISSSSSTLQDSPSHHTTAIGSSTHSLLDEQIHNEPQSYLETQQPQQIYHQVEDSMPSQQFMSDQHGIVMPSNHSLHAEHSAQLSMNLRALSNHTSHSSTPHDSQSPAMANAAFGSGGDSRRGSNHSEVASNFGGLVHLQMPTQHPHNSSGGVFKTPLNLAARRKHKPPPSLAMRTASSSVAQDLSSPKHAQPSLPAGAVRRIKSMGHGLSVVSGRIQKSSQHGSLRSPINTMPMRECIEDEIPSSATTAPVHTTGEMMSTQFATTANYPSSVYQARLQQQQAPASAGVVESQYYDSLVPSPSSMPPLSAALTQNSYEDPQWATSPPITPFFASHVEGGFDGTTPDLMGSYYGQMQQQQQQQLQQSIPQSAPAHITQFHVTHSPPLSAHPSTPTANHHFFPPTVPSQPHLHHQQMQLQHRHQRPHRQPSRAEQLEALFRAPEMPSPAMFGAGMGLHQQHRGQLQLQHHHHHHQHPLQHPRILRAESGADRTAAGFTGPGQFSSFFASPQPPPQKELEVVEVKFAEAPKTIPLNLSRNGAPFEFTFQNAGPEDFTPTTDD